MPKYKPPHCGSAYHFQECVCKHERQVHQDETGICKERRCDCIKYVLAPNYPEIEHQTLR